MAITDELRKYVSGMVTRGISPICKESLLAFADRIDAEHERALSNVYTDKMDASGWVRLPKDADGEYIHVGDRLEHTNGIFTANDMTISIDGIWRAWDGENGHTVLLAKCRHHKQPTVEDVLRDMHAKLDEVTALYVGEAIDSEERDSDEARIFAEYAAKLQLKENA